MRTALASVTAGPAVLGRRAGACHGSTRRPGVGRGRVPDGSRRVLKTGGTPGRLAVASAVRGVAPPAP